VVAAHLALGDPLDEHLAADLGPLLHVGEHSFLQFCPGTREASALRGQNVGCQGVRRFDRLF
jgi:hypothetical protein